PVDPVAGHIPGAVNAPGELPEIPADQEVGAYCGSGITAARAVLQLHERGREDAKLYVGSWSEWITGAGRPIATGERGTAWSSGTTISWAMTSAIIRSTRYASA